MASDKTDILAGTLALMVLRTLDALGPQHGYGIARRIEQISEQQLALNQGTLYPALLKLEHLGWIASKWRDSDTGRRAKYYSITRSGKKQLEAERENWQRAAAIIDRFPPSRRSATSTMGPRTASTSIRSVVRSWPRCLTSMRAAPTR
jgi:transcriptional regulator